MDTFLQSFHYLQLTGTAPEIICPRGQSPQFCTTHHCGTSICDLFSSKMFYEINTVQYQLFVCYYYDAITIPLVGLGLGGVIGAIDNVQSFVVFFMASLSHMLES